MLKLPSALWLGVLLSAGCFRASPPGSGAAGAGGAVVKTDAGPVCVENQLCIRGSHWDSVLCKCVPDEVAGSSAAGAAGAPVCVENVLCVRDAHWDSVLCKCVLDEVAGSSAAGAGGAPVCVENVLCVRDAHWDSLLCKCVPDEVAGSSATGAAGAPVCVERVLCVRDAHWDSVLCKCVLDNPDAGAGETCGASTCAADEHCCQVASASDGTCMPQCSRVCRAQPCKAPSEDAGAAQPCQAASDCSGPLPQLCASCVNANGGPQGSACAHWICKAGSCEIGICE
jgi:hypothetical protein